MVCVSVHTVYESRAGQGVPRCQILFVPMVMGIVFFGYRILREFSGVWRSPISVFYHVFRLDACAVYEEGMLLYFLLAVKKDSNLLQHMLAVTVIGGFFFSILWEAKTRYIFPYYIVMFPAAAIGYERAISFLMEQKDRFLGKWEDQSEAIEQKLAG